MINAPRRRLPPLILTPSLVGAMVHPQERQVDRVLRWVPYCRGNSPGRGKARTTGEPIGSTLPSGFPGIPCGLGPANLASVFTPIIIPLRSGEWGQRSQDQILDNHYCFQKHSGILGTTYLLSITFWLLLGLPLYFQQDVASFLKSRFYPSHPSQSSVTGQPGSRYLHRAPSPSRPLDVPLPAARGCAMRT